MAFKFRLESILKLRQRKEEQAQAEYQKAQAAVNTCLADIQAMYDQINQTRSFVHSNEKAKSSSQISSMQISHDFIAGQNIKIQRKRLEARDLMQVAEEKLETLKQAMVERKAIAKIKERKQAEFKKQLKRKEEKFYGDLAIMRAGSK